MVVLAEPLPVTLLSLPRFAQIMGINPVHFWGAIGPAAAFPLMNNRCNDVWPHYSWQFEDSLSHYEMAQTIQDVENTIAGELGWYPAPSWQYEDVVMFPRPYRRDAFRYGGVNVRGAAIGLKAEWAKIIAGGVRATTYVGTAATAGATLVYSDADGDGFYETATVTLPTTQTNALEMQVFINGTAAYPGWEIRPARTKSITAGVFTAVFDSWLFIDPDVLAEYPDANGFMAIDLSVVAPPGTIAPLVTSADVYRVYNDTTAVSAQFFWEPTPDGALLGLGGCCGSTTSNCAGCALTVQDGCLHVRDALRGIVVPAPATYNASTAAWESSSLAVCRDPDYVKMWYYAGEYGNKYLGSLTGDPLSERWALAIAQMTVARFERPLCSCGNAAALARKWQMDVIQGSNDLMVPQRDLDNPFGTRYGEILAWRTVSRERHRIRGGGAI